MAVSATDVRLHGTKYALWEFVVSSGIDLFPCVLGMRRGALSYLLAEGTIANPVS